MKRCVMEAMEYSFTDARQLAGMLLSKTIPNLNGQRRTLKPKNKSAFAAPAKKKARLGSLEVKRPSDPNRSSNTIERTASMSSTGSSQKVMPPCLVYVMLYLYNTYMIF
jgi:hypothetical protein